MVIGQPAFRFGAALVFFAVMPGLAEAAGVRLLPLVPALSASIKMELSAGIPLVPQKGELMAHWQRPSSPSVGQRLRDPVDAHVFCSCRDFRPAVATGLYVGLDR